MWIVTFIQQLLQAFNLFSKYVPPKTEAQKESDSEQKINDQLQKEQDGARPSWGK